MTDEPVIPPATRGVVTALAELVEGRAGEPARKIVAITGWRDADKPPIATLLRERLHSVHSGRNRHLVCELDAFMWESPGRAPDAALAAEVAKAVARERSWFRRAFQPVATAMATPRTRWWRRVGAAIVSAVLAGVVVALPDVRDLGALAGDESFIGRLARSAERNSAVTVGVLAVLFWFIAVRAWNATNAIARFVSSAKEEAATGTLEDVRGELDRLIDQALLRPRARRRRRSEQLRRRLVIVLRDVDRCADDFALALCETAVKLLRHDQVIVVWLGDLHGLQRAAGRKFLPPADGSPVLGSDERGRLHMRDLVFPVGLPPSRAPQPPPEPDAQAAPATEREQP